MHSIDNHIADVRQRVARAAQAAGRQVDSVRLIAVSKTHGIDVIRLAARTGISDFGENYVDEALPKIMETPALQLRWHFLGAIQSNKTLAIARNFAWVQTIDRTKVAERLSAQRPENTEPLNVLIQINIDAEPQKAGITPEALAEFAARLLELPRIRVRGLMAIPRPEVEPDMQRVAFRRMRALFENARPAGADCWDTLSMGMTHDFDVAIAEGATMIRIGTAIFGPREPRQHG